jgi:hypothetical protein
MICARCDPPARASRKPATITKDVARHVTDMARRIAALLLLGPKLDANYTAVKSNTYPWGQN